jgi:phosphohistidine swiveling domain-containing protein
MENNHFWVKNFEINRAGHHLMGPVFEVFDYCQQTLLDKIILSKGRFVFEGVNLRGCYLLEDDLLNLVAAIMDAILNNPAKVEQIHQETYLINRDYFSFAKKITKMNLAHLSDKDVGNLYSELIKHQKKAHGHSAASTWFLDSHEEPFSKYLLEKTEEIVKNSEKDSDFAQVFSDLTTLPRNSFALDEEVETLEILKLIKENQIAVNTLLALGDFSRVPDEFGEEIKLAIEKLLDKWRWVPFTYIGPPYDLDYYLMALKGLLKEEINPDQRIQEIKERPQKVAQKRERLIAEYNLSLEQQRIYNIAADIVYLKGYRKDCLFHGFYATSFILKEIAKRRSLSLNQMYLLTDSEVVDILVHEKEITADVINPRMGFTVWTRNVGEDYQIFTGEEAKEIFSRMNIKEEVIDSNISEMQGTTACSGTASGIVKIVNVPEDISKMEEGDIMVSHSTFPSLVPAMKKAAAIITEDGGITCHAAIVSRELGTPCVTGIKTATKVLKDGDFVEVNASEGIVRIIK